MYIFRGDVNQLRKGNGSHYIPQTCKSHDSSQIQLCFSSFFSPGISLSGPFLLEISVKSLRMRAAFLASDFRLDGIGLLTADKREMSYLKSWNNFRTAPRWNQYFPFVAKTLVSRTEGKCCFFVTSCRFRHTFRCGPESNQGQINKHQTHISEPLKWPSTGGSSYLILVLVFLDTIIVRSGADH